MGVVRDLMIQGGLRAARPRLRSGNLRIRLWMGGTLRVRDGFGTREGGLGAYFFR